MAKELNEDTSFKVSIKTLIAIGVGITTVSAFQVIISDTVG